jgi:hypothetical protein
VSSAIEYARGGYSFIEGVSQYSGGVAALPGFQIERVRFREMVPLSGGFQRIAQLLTELGRPLNALCGCELRSPKPFTEQGFKAFNAIYLGELSEWKIPAHGLNPVARSNVCPAIDPPVQPSFYAFSYTMPTTQASSTFVISGSAENPEGRATYRDHIVAFGDTSASALRQKAQWVTGEMERRMAALGRRWTDTSAVQVYTVHDIHSILPDEIVRRGAARNGLTWHFCRPPVIDLEYEMDCRQVSGERILTA